MPGICKVRLYITCTQHTLTEMERGLYTSSKRQQQRVRWEKGVRIENGRSESETVLKLLRAKNTFCWNAVYRSYRIVTRPQSVYIIITNICAMCCMVDARQSTIASQIYKNKMRNGIFAKCSTIPIKPYYFFCTSSQAHTHPSAA